MVREDIEAYKIITNYNEKVKCDDKALEVMDLGLKWCKRKVEYDRRK
jgi:hypothetical protein